MEILVLRTSEHFGKQLRKHRLSRMMTQMEVARRMNCTSDNICHFEKGDATVGNGSIKTVFNYAKALGYNEVTFKLTTDENTIQEPAHTAGV